MMIPPLPVIRKCLEFRAIRTAPADPIHGDAEYVHFWQARFSAMERHYRDFSRIIDPAEQAEAARFRKPADSRTYVLSHGMLRSILGAYSGQSPQSLRFTRDRNGRLHLVAKEGYQLGFSLSHSEEMAGIGVSKTAGIGLDVVRPTIRYPFLPVAHFLFRPGEARWIEQAPLKEQRVRFFRVWAIKEALLKASGGNARMMHDIDLSGIMEERLLDGIYPVFTGRGNRPFFIYESRCEPGHLMALAGIPPDKPEFQPAGA